MKTHKAQSGKSTIKVKARVERPSTSSDSSDDSYSDSFSDSDDTSDCSDTGDTDSTCSTGSSDCSGSRSDSSPSSSCSSSSSSEESTPTPRKKVKTSVCNTGNRLLLKKSPLPKSRDSTLNTTSKFGGKGRKNTHDIGNKQTNTKKTTKRMKCQDIRETSKSGNAKTSALKRTKEKKHQTVKVKRISSATARNRSETGSASGESQTRPVAGCKSGMKRSFSQSSSANPGLKDMATKCKTAKCKKT